MIIPPSYISRDVFRQTWLEDQDIAAAVERQRPPRRGLTVPTRWFLETIRAVLSRNAHGRSAHV